jgi:hypothetical protein
MSDQRSVRELVDALLAGPNDPLWQAVRRTALEQWAPLINRCEAAEAEVANLRAKLKAFVDGIDEYGVIDPETFFHEQINDARIALGGAKEKSE